MGKNEWPRKYWTVQKKAPLFTIPGKTFEKSKNSSYSKSAPIKYYNDNDFFIGSPRSGLRLEQAKKCEMLFLDQPEDDQLDEPKDLTLTGEGANEKEYS